MLIERRSIDVYRSLRRRNKRITKHQVSAVISELKRKNKPYKNKKNRPSLKSIFEATCTVFNLEIKTKSRKRQFAYSRYIYIHKALSYGYSLAAVGKLINRKHTTIMHGRDIYYNLLLDKIFLNEYISKENEVDNLIKVYDEIRKKDLQKSLVLKEQS